MSFQILLFIAGLFLLLQGANYLIDGSVNIARRFKVSRLVIGLTVVAMGTSAPELTVNVISALEGESALLLSNISGSNIMNILLILGLTALIARIPVERKLITREFPFLIISGLAFFVMLLDARLVSGGVLHSTEGIVLLALFAAYMVHLFSESRKVNAVAEHDRAKGSMVKNVLFLGLGLIGLVIGAKLMVDSAIIIATALGVSTTLIGVTVVALGTSLPELASSIVAARKDETDLALGNIIGSNIFNILLVVGVSSVISPSPIVASFDNVVDVGVALGASVVLLFLLFVSNARKKKFEISRLEGGVMLLLLAGYLAYIVVRG